MAAGRSGSSGLNEWVKDISNRLTCRRRTEDESEIVAESSNFSRQNDEEKSDQALKAIKNNDVEALQRILSSTDLKSGAWDLREKDQYGRTVLHLVTGKKRFCKKAKDILEMLLEYTDLVNETDKFENTALKLAVENGHSEAIDILISHGGDVNKCDNGENTPLHRAVDKKNISVVKILLMNGADPNVPNKSGETPLHCAVTAESEKIVELLLNHNASRNMKNKNGYTPQDLAEIKGHDKMMDLFKDQAIGRRNNLRQHKVGQGAHIQSDSDDTEMAETSGLFRVPLTMAANRGDTEMAETASGLLKALTVAENKGLPVAKNMFITIVGLGGSAAIGDNATYTQTQGQLLRSETEGENRITRNEASRKIDESSSMYLTRADENKGNLAIGDSAQISVNNSCRSSTQELPRSETEVEDRITTDEALSKTDESSSTYQTTVHENQGNLAIGDSAQILVNNSCSSSTQELPRSETEVEDRKRTDEALSKSDESSSTYQTTVHENQGNLAIGDSPQISINNPCNSSDSGECKSSS